MDDLYARARAGTLEEQDRARLRDAVLADPAAVPLRGLSVDDLDPVAVPGGDGEGHWVGAPATHRYGGADVLAVRWRDPDRRGHRIDLYHDGAPATALTADELGVVSVERAAFATSADGLQVYVPTEHGSNDWTVQALDAVADLADLDPATAEQVLGQGAAGETDAVTVKDPAVCEHGDGYLMYYAGHDGTAEQAHVAASADGRDWDARGVVLARGGWHDHHTRVTARVPLADREGAVLTYDGSGTADAGNTWNLRTGLAYSPAPEVAVDLTPDEPYLSAAPGDDGTGLDAFGTCRYLAFADGAVYAEVARDDGSFGLCRAEA